MAKLSAVIAVLSDALGMPETAVESYAKSLRKAGLITSGPRGTAAPDIPPDQMARLLIAILIGSPAHAVERVNYYGSLKCNCTPPKDELAFMTKFDLKPSHTFLEMLTKHIEFLADGSFFQRGVDAAKEADIYQQCDLEEAIRRHELNNNSDDEFLEEIGNGTFVDLYDPYPGAAITLSTCLFMASEMVEDIRIYYTNPRFHRQREAGEEYEELPFPIKQSDLSHRSRVTNSTLRMLGDLLKNT